MTYNRVLVTSRTFGKGLQKEQLYTLFHSHSLEPTFLSPEGIAEKISEFDGLIIGSSKVTRSLLANARRLKVIIKYGVGIDNIDINAAHEFGVKVLNLPGINSQAVAELALGMMFVVARKITEGERAIRNGSYGGIIGTSVVGKTLGIIGTGSIGCALARMVSGLDMTILGYDIKNDSSFITSGGKYVSLDYLLQSADFVSLHLPLTKQTVHFIDREKLKCMKKGAFLINTSRGGIVDEQALMEELSAGQLAGAALDVFASEPQTLKELFNMENVVVTPHIGAYTNETLRRMDETCISALSDALRNNEKKEPKG